MPNVLGPNGLQVQTQAELVAYFTQKYQDIYGADINLSSDSPDGQMMNEFIQAVLDVQDLLVQIYNMFDPDNAIGVVLDQRVAINGIERQGGTFTVTPVTLVLSQSENLYGLDQATFTDTVQTSGQPVYTVADNAGTRYQLQVTQLGLAAGTHILDFQAAAPGAQLTVPNTIDVQVTIVLGVTSVNNPSAATTVGVNEEADAVLKVRRQKSVALPSQGYLAGLLAALENINGVTSAFVYENLTSTTDGNGVPGHSIWVIVAGSGVAASIAQAIYSKRNAGCGMFGDTSYTITQVDGTDFVVLWDDVAPENLFMTFVATSINGSTAPNIAAIRAGLVTSFVPGVNAEVNINELATLVQQIDPNCLVIAAGFSLGFSQVLDLSGVAASGAFKISYNGNLSASIAWNDSISTIQTKVQAVTGLTAALVTGSIASQELVFDLSDVDVQGLVSATQNTLQTAGLAAITFAYDEGYSNTLSPSTKKNQFIVSAPNIIITPMLMSPASASVVHSTTKQFSGLGGYGTLVYSMQSSPSGGSVNSSTGLYTAGATPALDVVKVTDNLGNTATASVTVT